MTKETINQLVEVLLDGRKQIKEFTSRVQFELGTDNNVSLTLKGVADICINRHIILEWLNKNRYIIRKHLPLVYLSTTLYRRALQGTLTPLITQTAIDNTVKSAIANIILQNETLSQIFEVALLELDEARKSQQ